MDMFQYCTPYWQKRETFVKGRWCGQTLLAILTKEFKSFNQDYYEAAIQQGKYQILRGQQKINACELIKQGDVLQSWQHKHEPPIPLMPKSFEVVFEDRQLLVINKPNGIPIHPTGNYYKHTLLYILSSSNCNGSGFDPVSTDKLLTCHRLDKDTSGVVILAKDSQTASEWQKDIAEHRVNKLYLAKVQGRFPGAKTQVNTSDFNIDENCTVADSPIYTLEINKGVKNALGVSKAAKTLITPIKYDSVNDQSVVACRPVTGRTHQIRIHCARLGYPIVNDPLYNNESEFGKFVRQVEKWEDFEDPSAMMDWLQLIHLERRAKLNKLMSTDNDIKNKCNECGVVLKNSDENEKPSLRLHSWKYDNGIQFFETSLPEWF